MNLIYADSSALMRAYVTDEPGHDALRQLLLEAGRPVMVSEVARIEVASALAEAHRRGRIGDAGPLLDRFDADSSEAGPIALVSLRPEVILPAARRIVIDHSVGTLDAIHIAVALEEGPLLSQGELPDFLTLDRRQATAARACGLNVRES